MGWFRNDEPRLVRVDEITHYRTGPEAKTANAGTPPTDRGEGDPTGTGVSSWSTQVNDADQQWGSVGSTWLVDDHPAATEALADGFDSWGVTR